MDDELVLKPTLKAKSTLKKGPGSDGHDDLVEFVLLAVKAVIHHFLFQRKVYPDRWFKSERVFLTHTQACRHPSVRDYISEAAGSIKDALSAGHVETICVGLQCPGCALHEMLCIHPSILLPQQTDTRPPWEEIDDALRGLLLQLQHLNFAMPPPKEGTVFCISVQMQNKKSLPDQEWALYEDPVQSAIAAAQAQPSAQHSHAAPPPADPARRHSTSGADTAAHGSLQSPYVSAQHPAHGSGSGGQHAPFADPPPAAPTPEPAALAADASDPAARHPGAAQQHVEECMHDVGFGRGSGMHAAEGGVVWGSQQSQGVQSQTQQGPTQAAGLGRPDQGSNSAQRPGSAVRPSGTGSQPQAPGQPQHMHPLSGSSPAAVQRQEVNIQAAGRKRPGTAGAGGGAERHGKAARTGADGVDACGVRGSGRVTGMTRIAATAGDSAAAAIAKAAAEDSPLLETLEQDGHGGPGNASPADGRERQSKDDTESYGTAGCPRFQAAQIVAPDPEAAPSPTAVTVSGSPVRAALLAASPGGTDLVSGHGDTLLQDGSPVAHSVPPRQRGWSAQRGGSRGPSGGGGGGGGGGALASGGILHEALVPQPNGGPSVGEPAASSSLVATEPQGDTLIEEDAPGRGRAVELAGDASGGEEATSPGESPEEAGDAPGTGSAPMLAADVCARGSDRIELGDAVGPGPAAGSGSRELGQSHQTGSQEYKAARGDSDGEPDYFADLMGSGPFRGFGQQPEARVSHSGVSDGQPPGSIGTGEDAQAAPASPSAAADASSDHEKGGIDYSCPPAAPVAEMVLRPLVDSCIPGVLEIRANVLHLRQKPHKR